MRRYVLLVGLIVALLFVGTTNALEVQKGNITIDGNVSEWLGNATVLTFRSMMNPVELDSFYFMHNNTHYLIGARLYDNDNATDEWVNFYLTDGTTTILAQIQEGSNVAELYELTGNNLVKIGNISVATTKSVMGAVKNPYVNIEFAIPKTLLNNATNVKVFIERKAKLMRGMLVGSWNLAEKVRFKMKMEDWMDRFSKVTMMDDYAEVVGGYPVGATKDNPDTWANLTFVDSFGTNTLQLTLPEVVGVTTIEIYNGTSTSAPLLTVIPAKTNMSINLPSNVTIVVNVSGVPVLTKTYSINQSLSDNLTPNIKTVDTGFAKTVIAVQENASFTAYFDVDSNRTIITITGENVTNVFVESNVSMVVLSADNLAYNPITNRARFSVFGNDTVYIWYPKEVCVLAADKLEDCECLKNHLRLKVGAGKVIISNPKTPFAIADDGVAMKRDINYTDNDGGNITVITTDGGTLDVYYDNPCNMSVKLSNGTIVVSVSTPYSFNGLVNVSISNNVVISKKVFVKAPYSEIVIDLSNVSTSSITTATSEAVITVYDLDSKQTIGTKSLTYLEITALQMALILVAIVGIVVIAIVVAKRSKQTVREHMERDFKYFRKL